MIPRTYLAAAAAVLATAAFLAASSSRAPQARGAGPETPAPPASRGSPLDGLPDYAMPFLHYAKPERVFFTTPNTYNGPGRESHEFESDPEIRMGLLAPLDGPAKAYGIEMQRGAMLAVKEWNAKGGVAGKPIKLFSRDDKGTMGDAANGAVGLIHDDRVLAILGTVHSGNTHVLARVALKTETPFLTSVSTDPTILQHSIPWAFRCLVDDQPQGRALASYLFETKKYTKVCTMWFNNKYGRQGIQEIRNIARRLGHPVLYDLSFNGGDKDFTTQLTKVKESGAEALVLWGLYKEISAIVIQARAMNLEVELVGGDGFVSQAFLDLAGPAAEGVVATYPYDVEATDAANRAFVAAYEKEYGRTARLVRRARLRRDERAAHRRREGRAEPREDPRRARGDDRLRGRHRTRDLRQRRQRQAHAPACPRQERQVRPHPGLKAPCSPPRSTSPSGSPRRRGSWPALPSPTLPPPRRAPRRSWPSSGRSRAAPRPTACRSATAPSSRPRSSRPTAPGRGCGCVSSSPTTRPIRRRRGRSRATSSRGTAWRPSSAPSTPTAPTRSRWSARSSTCRN